MVLFMQHTKTCVHSLSLSLSFSVLCLIRGEVNFLLFFCFDNTHKCFPIIAPQHREADSESLVTLTRLPDIVRTPPTPKPPKDDGDKEEDKPQTNEGSEEPSTPTPPPTPPPEPQPPPDPQPPRPAPKPTFEVVIMNFKNTLFMVVNQLRRNLILARCCFNQNFLCKGKINLPGNSSASQESSGSGLIFFVLIEKCGHSGSLGHFFTKSCLANGNHAKTFNQMVKFQACKCSSKIPFLSRFICFGTPQKSDQDISNRTFVYACASQRAPNSFSAQTPLHNILWQIPIQIPFSDLQTIRSPKGHEES